MQLTNDGYFMICVVPLAVRFTKETQFFVCVPIITEQLVLELISKGCKE